MYYLVSLGNSIKTYLYQSCDLELELGMVVIVPTGKDNEKQALIVDKGNFYVEKLGLDDEKVKSIYGRETNCISQEVLRKWILGLIERYKEGVITKEKVSDIMEGIIEYNSLDFGTDILLEEIVMRDIPDICLFYVIESGNEDEKELEFWKSFKDVEWQLLYGYTFKERKNRVHDIEDPIEYTDKYMRVELQLERMIKAQIGEKSDTGYCHLYWHAKKKILKEQFGIDWKSPRELNPKVRYD